MPVILEELNDACAEWYNIAMQLQVSVNKLDCIQEQCNNPTACLRKALQIWLENYTTPTWNNIVNVLRSKTVNKTRLAEELDSKYCCGESVSIGKLDGVNPLFVCAYSTMIFIFIASLIWLEI